MNDEKEQHRPRLRPPTSHLLQELKDEIGFLKAENVNVAKYENEKGRIADDRVIREALRTLQREGL